MLSRVWDQGQQSRPYFLAFEGLCSWSEFNKGQSVHLQRYVLQGAVNINLNTEDWNESFDSEWAGAHISIDTLQRGLSVFAVGKVQ